MRLLGVGFDNFVVAERVVAVLGCQSAPLRRLIQEYRASSRLVDATQGRRMRALLLLDGGYLVASALTPETLARRLARQNFGEPVEEGPAEPLPRPARAGLQDEREP